MLYWCDFRERVNCLQQCTLLVRLWLESGLLTAVCFVGVIVVRELIAYSSELYWCECGKRVNCIQQCALLVRLWLESELLTAVWFIGVIVFVE